MACAIAREVRDGETVAVGTLAPIPAAGALLAHFTHAPRATVVIMNHPDYWPFRNGSKEFYDFAQRGKLDLFFLSGGQIDRHANLNLIAVGDPARPRVRFPGGAGAAMLYYLPAKDTWLLISYSASRAVFDRRSDKFELSLSSVKLQ